MLQTDHLMYHTSGHLAGKTNIFIVKNNCTKAIFPHNL